MSFDKAVIRRFNEESSCAPPPTKYDPKMHHGSCAKDINFIQYSGRKEHCKMKDGFVTPAKLPRGRPYVCGSASTRSCSDTRLRKESRTVSTKSLKEITISLPTGGGQNTELKKEDEEGMKILKNLQVELIMADEKNGKMKLEFEDEKRNLASINVELQQKLDEVTTSYTSEKFDLINKLEVLTSSFRTLDEDHSILKLQNQRLKEESALQIELLEDERKNHEEKNEIFKSENQRLKSEEEELKKKLAQVGNDMNELNSQLTFLHNQNKQYLSEKENVEKKCVVLDEELQALRNKVEEETSSIEILKTKLNDDHEKFVEVQSLFECDKQKWTSEKLDLENRLEEITSLHKTLDGEHCKFKRQYKHLPEESSLKIELFEDELKHHEEVIGILKSENKRLKTEEEKYKTKLAEAGNDMTELNSQVSCLQEQNRRYLSDKDNLQQQLVVCEKEIQALRSKVEEETSSIEILKTKLNDDHEKFIEVQSLFESDKQKWSSEKLDLENKLAELTSSYKTLDGEHCNLKLQYEDLQGECALKIELLEDERENHEEMIGILKSENQRLKSEEEELKTKLAEAGNDMTELNSQINCLQEQNRQYLSEKENVEKKCVVRDEEIQVLRNKVEEETSSIEILKTKLNDEHVKFIEVQSLFDSDKQNWTSEKSDLETRLEELTSLHKTLDGELCSLKLQYEHLQGESALKIELLEDEQKNQEEMIGILKSENQRLKSEEEEYKTKLAEAENDVTELNSQVNCLQEQNRRYLLEKENLEKKCVVRNEEIQLLRNKVDEETSSIEILKTKLNDEHVKFIEVQSLFESDKQKWTAEKLDLGTKLEELTSLYKTLDGEHCTLKLQYEHLQGESALKIELVVDEQKNQEEIIVILKSENQRLKSEEEELKTKLSEAGNDMTELNSQVNCLQEQNRRYLLGIDNLQQQLVVCEKEIQVLRNKVDEETSSIDILKTKLNDDHEKFIEVQSIFESDRQKWTSEKLDFENKLEELTSLYKTLDGEHCNLKLQLRLELPNAQLYLNDMSTLKSENAILKDQSQNAAHKNERDQETIKSLTEVLQKYKEEEQNMLQKESNIESLQNFIKTLMHEKAALKETLDQYKSVYGDYANLASHQNNRQKIKHLVNLKDEIIKLRDENSHLRQELSDMKEKVRRVPPPASSSATRRFDPKQAFKPVLKEPFIHDERDVRGPDARSTFTVPKKTNLKPTVTLINSTKEPKQGMAFDVQFSENKEN